MNAPGLEERARAWRRQGRRAVLAEAAASSACGAAAAFGALALLDRAASLPQAVRAAGFAAWAAWQAWVLARVLAAPWTALTWSAVFDAAASAWPETRAVFASAWALRAGTAARGTSEELRLEHAARADRLAAALPDRPLFAWTPSRRARGLAVAAAALAAANAVWGDGASWTRVVAPWSDSRLESWVELTPEGARLTLGATAEIVARPNAEGAAAGVRAGALRLEARGADGGWRGLAWTRVGPEKAEWRQEEFAAPLDYRVRWRDRESRAYRLEPVPPPRWIRAAAEVRGGRGARRWILGEDSTVRARRGDWVEIEGEPDGALASADLLVSGRPAAPMRREGPRWKGGFLASEDGTISFDLVASDGRRDASPPRYALTVAADAPPVAELLSPQVPLAVSPQDAVVIAYAARDDGAITSVSLVLSIPGRPPRALPLPVPSPARADVLGDTRWTPSDLKPGTRVEFWIEATDDASPRQRSVSEKGSLEIVDAEADHAAALAARDAADAALERAAAAAERARDAARAGDREGSAQRTRGLRADWSAAKDALAEWARRAQADPRGDPGLGEEAARGAEEFSRAGERSLPAAEEALAKPDLPAAARAQDALAGQARGVQKALREGARAQEAQDLARKMESAGRTGDDLSRRAGELAARGSQGTVSAAELEALRTSLTEVEKALEELRRAVKELPELTPEQASGRSEDLPLDDARSAAGEMSRALQSGDVAAAAKAARRLAESLKRLARTLDGAGRRAAESRGARANEAAASVRRAWRDAVDAQTAAVESARRVEDGRLRALLAEQRELLKKAGAEFDRELSSPSAEAKESGALPALAEASRRLKAGDAPAAARLARAAAARLRAVETTRPAGTPTPADELDALAAGLQQGPPPPAADPAGARAAADEQASALGRARALHAAVAGAVRDGYLSGRLSRRAADAVSVEDAGEKASRRGDTTEGLRRAEAALTILQDGSKDADAAASAAAGASAAMGGGGGAGFSVRLVPRGAAGERYERVRLPTADEYRPPRELREELERSLREPRPAARDGAIKEYFKRLAR